MLGQQVGDVRGQTISTRVLPDEGSGPRMEITDQSIGTLCGLSVTSTVTYVGTMRPTGVIQGFGHGIVMSAEGETATFTGHGVATITRPGATSWRGTLIYESQTPTLSRLNGVAVVFEYEVDEGGKSEGHFYEWK
jgi:hypothetical protein